MGGPCDIMCVCDTCTKKENEYKQREDTPTGFCKECGRIPSQCECKNED